MMVAPREAKMRKYVQSIRDQVAAAVGGAVDLPDVSHATGDNRTETVSGAIANCGAAAVANCGAEVVAPKTK
jgi:hypothetical protein